MCDFFASTTICMSTTPRQFTNTLCHTWNTYKLRLIGNQFTPRKFPGDNVQKREFGVSKLNETLIRIPFEQILCLFES